MSVAKEQREKLIWEFPNIGKKAPEQEEKAFAYCEGYKEFLNAAKRLVMRSSKKEKSISRATRYTRLTARKRF